jgi:hypothetical protein
VDVDDEELGGVIEVEEEVGTGTVVEEDTGGATPLHVPNAL